MCLLSRGGREAVLEGAVITETRLIRPGSCRGSMVLGSRAGVRCKAGLSAVWVAPNHRCSCRLEAKWSIPQGAVCPCAAGRDGCQAGAVPRRWPGLEPTQPQHTATALQRLSWPAQISAHSQCHFILFQSHWNDLMSWQYALTLNFYVMIQCEEQWCQLSIREGAVSLPEVAPLGIESLGSVFTLCRCISCSVLGSANFGCLLLKQIMSVLQ